MLYERVIKKNEDEKDEYGRTKWSGPEGIAGDDRCGVYIILEFLKSYHTRILFCEKIGRVGSEKFITTKYINDLRELYYFIQIDRSHCHKNIYNGYNEKGRDIVFYNVNNKIFINKINDLTGYGIGKGSSTDIVGLKDETKVASFNISCGYYNEHTLSEYIVIDEMINYYNAIENIINNVKEKYEAFV